MNWTGTAEIAMTEKRSKYDTDPLDPDFVRRTEEVRPGPTRDVGRAPNPQAEEPTRPLAPEPPTTPLGREAERERFSTSYPSVFIPQPQQTYRPPTSQAPPPPRPHAAYGAPQTQTPPPYGAPVPAYQQQQQPYISKPTQRPVSKLGIPENYALVLPYAPFYIGVVAALVELLLVPRTETRTRFHAAQALALQLVMMAGSIIFGIVGAITDSRLGGRLFGIAAFIFLIVSMVRVWQGKPHHIAPLDDLTQKLNQKLEPRK